MTDFFLIAGLLSLLAAAFVLRRTLFKPVFADLWAIRHEL